MKRLLLYKILMLLTIVGGVACSTNTTSEGVKSSVIGIYVYDISDADLSMRATPLQSVSDLTEFRVFAYDEDGAAYINNLQAIYSDFVWGFSPEQYWTSGSLNFICYAPSSSDSNGMSVASLGDNNLTISYLTPTDVTLQPDIVVATPVECVEDGGVVEIEFSHKLSGVALKIAGDSSVEVTSVTISGVHDSSTLSLDNDTYSWATPTTSTSGLSYAMGLIDVASPQSSDEYTTVTAEDGYLMMLPQEIPTSATFTIAAKNSEGETVESVYSFGEGAEWVEGNIYIYSLLFEEQGEAIVFVDIEVIPWNEYIIDGDMLGGAATPESDDSDGVLILPSQISVSGWKPNESTDLN
ncbi:MAG: fimbrillin family protein [Rikenellaceae bacterium]